MQMITQRGFGILLYAVAAIAVMGMVGAGYHTVKKSGYTEAVAEYQPKLDAAEASIKAQNEALDALKAAGDAKAKAAAKALAGASKKADTWEKQAARLAAVLTGRKPDGPVSCAAAWEEIRKP